MNVNVIDLLRNYCGADGEVGDNTFRVISDVIHAYKPKGYVVEDVENSFEEGGRWSNYETTVYKVEENKVTAYFRMTEEIPATEMQEGGYFDYSFDEVEPKEVTVIKYVKKEAV